MVFYLVSNHSCLERYPEDIPERNLPIQTLMKKKHHSTTASSKSEQILQAAMRVFLQHGYAGTSMERVAIEAGVSKPTLYSYFQNKQGLFTALIERATLSCLQVEFGSELFKGEPAALLPRLARVVLTKMNDPEYIALLRLVMAESARFPELGQLYTRTVIQPGNERLSLYLKSHPELNILNTEGASRIFFGSLVAFVICQEILYGKQVMPMDNDLLIDSLVSLMLSHTQIAVPKSAMPD